MTVNVFEEMGDITKPDKCWNPGCSNSGTSLVSGNLPRHACESCLTEYYNRSCFCPGCGWGYGATEEPTEEDNYYIGCDFCDKWTHRICDGNVGVGEEALLEKYACVSCQLNGNCSKWHWLIEHARNHLIEVNPLYPRTRVLPNPMFVAVSESVKTSSPIHPCVLVGFDFRQKLSVVVITANVRSNRAVWLQWNVKPDCVMEICSIDKLRTEKTSSEWGLFEQSIFIKDHTEWPKGAKKRFAETRKRLSEIYTEKTVNDEPTLVTGLVDPTEDVAIEDGGTVSMSEEALLPSLSVVWAKVPGTLWAPGIVTGFNNTGATEYVVFFLEGVVPVSHTEEISTSNIPSWLAAELECEVQPWERLSTAKYAFLPQSAVKPWKCQTSEQMLKLIKGARKRELFHATEIAESIDSGAIAIPAHMRKDALARSRAQKHAEESLQAMTTVRPALKLQHLKLFLETNLVELHWRTIARARQYVRVVHDETFGGYHLIAAQDWPTDREIDEGKEQDVFLVYPGRVLTSEEAHSMEAETQRDVSDLSAVHVDRNRYVAEIPGTVTILDKNGQSNLNSSGFNFYVDGIEYADPNSALWAPAPTVNHERVEYCKLEPHHSTADSMKGFWLQRKRGEIIHRGEPLFWSYDCGAGKFDADFGLIGKPPPVGWKPSQARKKVKIDQIS